MTRRYFLTPHTIATKISEIKISSYLYYSLEESFVSKMYVGADIQLTYNFGNIEQKTSN